ncbi:uncharacterized protein N7515_009957 [Penicillium bovifimosum]|uniref:Uncharacterized protein n=1 Tax=Penicillium bovifimosum TaxID=126998 RepID=A0A9W9GIN9_9EURO|nr:uncharacterized protein N7515_009957 [Penicillium bovifimosum]KAJ5120569.1 hypothetical protein N7515_009957 [Penicillium bovifimosum]
MRRGSPNTQAIHDMGGVPRPYSMMPPPQQTAGEQASIQLSQQMNNMMQMQMQWMQQMMQMQGMQGMQGQPMMQGMPTPPMMMPGGMMAPPPMSPPSVSPNPNMRPMSMPAGSVLNLPPSVPPHIDQRTLSMLDPNISTRRTGSPMPNLSGSPFRPRSGYAPSIAPSERSNAGLAPRYRPVSTMQPESNYATASPSNKPFVDENLHPSMAMPQSHIPKSHLATVTVRPVSRGSRPGTGLGSQPLSPEDEENDEEAWADMIKKRDKKKSSWKMKRGTSSFSDLLSAVH